MRMCRRVLYCVIFAVALGALLAMSSTDEFNRNCYSVTVGNVIKYVKYELSDEYEIWIEYPDDGLFPWVVLREPEREMRYRMNDLIGVVELGGFLRTHPSKSIEEPE